MKIRNLIWRGLPMWPPEWDFSNQGVSEEGILEGVRLRDNLRKKMISVAVNYLGEEHKGIIVLDDPNLLEILYNKLKENIGKPLKLIGDIELCFGLPLQEEIIKAIKPSSNAKRKICNWTKTN